MVYHIKGYEVIEISQESDLRLVYRGELFHWNG